MDDNTSKYIELVKRDLKERLSSDRLGDDVVTNIEVADVGANMDVRVFVKSDGFSFFRYIAWEMALRKGVDAICDKLEDSFYVWLKQTIKE